MRFFTDLERSLFCGVEMEREERMMSTAVLREIEREESVCAVDVGVFLCVVCGRSVPDDEGVICRWIHDDDRFRI